MSAASWLRRALVVTMPALTYATASPAVAASPTTAPAAAHTAAPSTASNAAPSWPAKTVTYGPARFSVPAAWPVYDLRHDPARCVRMDVHAVYLGVAGPDAVCPSRALGKTEALQVSPQASGSAGREGAGSAASHDVVARFDRLGVVATASYADNDRLAREIVATFRPSGGAALHAAATHPPKVANATPSVTTTRSVTSTSRIYTGYGFDACTAPSTAAMKSWLASSYRAVGVYIGGANRACGDGNLSASWVGSVTSMGWRLIPIYVGLQAPCVGQSRLAHISTSTSTAAAQGTSSADDAVAQAKRFGMPTGSPVYFDMEAYSTDSTCRKAVYAFLDAWTVQLHRLGYVSGVYSSSASGIRDQALAVGTAGYHLPDDIWMANWNGRASVFGDPYVKDGYWSDHQRLHQYLGGHNATYGGVTINIDSNYLDGAVVSAVGATRPAVPAAPVGVSATPADGSAVVTWSPPTGPVSRYVVTASPGGASVTVPATARSAVLPGLTNGAAYTTSVAAANPSGSGPVARAAAVTPSPNAGSYFPVTPVRVLDTRSGRGAPRAQLGPGATLTVRVAGAAGSGVPATGVSAVALNVTATGASTPTYIVAHADAARPAASNLNVGPGETVANFLVTRVASDGTVKIYNRAGSVSVLADVQGFFTTAASGATYRPLTPARVLDTRNRSGPVGPGKTVVLKVAGVGGVPSTGVSAVALNVTATQGSAATYISVYPGDAARPPTSSLNPQAGQSLANLVVTRVAGDGTVRLYNHSGSTHLVADVQGYFTTASSGATYRPLTLARVLDTRTGQGATKAKLGPGQSLVLQVAGAPGSGLPARDLSAVAVNVTATNVTASTYLSVYPSDANRPPTSSINLSAGQTLAGVAVSRVSRDGTVTIYNSAGTVDVIADVEGFLQ